MLKEITVQNFKSICNETTLSLEADHKRVNELKEHLVDINGEKLLRVCSIYGPNGGGKSNVLDAVMLLKFVTLRGRRRSEDTNLSCVFSDEKEITIRAFFVNNKYKLGYQISFIATKVSPLEEDRFFGRAELVKFEILSEMLFVEEDLSYVKLFERNRWTW